MATPDPRLRALYARLEEVLGSPDAETLMTYLPAQPGAELATKTDLRELSARLEVRFDRMDRRFERLEDRFVEGDRKFERMDERFGQVRDDLRDQLKVYTVTTIGGMTALTAIYTGILAVIV